MKRYKKDYALLASQYMRWLPAHLGLTNKGAFLLQIRRILNDDIYLLSYPKSGNTWLRYILAHVVSGKNIESENQLEQVIPDVYRSQRIINRMSSGRIIKTHHPLFSHYPRIIYIHRDYRDVLVSYYYYQTALGIFTGNFSEFIRSSAVTHPFGSWAQHVQEAIAFSKTHPDRIFILSYDDLHRAPEQKTSEIIKFFHLPQKMPLQQAVEASRINKLREKENKTPGFFIEQSGKSFFRSGHSGDWQAYFSANDLDYIYAQPGINSLLQTLGYLSSNKTA